MNIIKKYTIVYKLIMIISLLTGCSTKEVNGTVNAAGMMVIGAPLVVAFSPILVPLAIADYKKEKELIQKKYKNFNTKKTILTQLDLPCDTYIYNENEIFAYYDKKLKEGYLHNIYFLINNEKVLGFYTELDDIKEWKKYKLIKKE